MKETRRVKITLYTRSSRLGFTLLIISLTPPFRPIKCLSDSLKVEEIFQIELYYYNDKIIINNTTSIDKIY